MRSIGLVFFFFNSDIFLTVFITSVYQHHYSLFIVSKKEKKLNLDHSFFLNNFVNLTNSRTLSTLIERNICFLLKFYLFSYGVVLLPCHLVVMDLWLRNKLFAHQANVALAYVESSQNYVVGEPCALGLPFSIIHRIVKSWFLKHYELHAISYVKVVHFTS